MQSEEKDNETPKKLNKEENLLILDESFLNTVF